MTGDGEAALLARADDGSGSVSGAPQQRKRRKRKRKLEEQGGEAEEGAADGADAIAAPSSTARSRRFIVFVGNLPYRLTRDRLLGLFGSAGAVTACRMPTSKQTRKPKGYAFVEYDDAESLQRALLLHHALLDGRRLNVELTAGGGGTGSAVRRERLKTKNAQLSSERKRRRGVGGDGEEAVKAAAEAASGQQGSTSAS